MEIFYFDAAFIPFLGVWNMTQISWQAEVLRILVQEFQFYTN